MLGLEVSVLKPNEVTRLSITQPFSSLCSEFSSLFVEFSQGVAVSAAGARARARAEPRRNHKTSILSGARGEGAGGAALARGGARGGKRVLYEQINVV